MSAYRKLTETLRDAVARKADASAAWILSSRPGSQHDSWSRALALLEDELAAMGDDE